MEFKSDSHKAAYERVTEMVRALYGEMATPDTDRPNFWLSYGSAVVRIIVTPIDDTNNAVAAHSWVVTGVETTPELMQFLLRENYNLRFGAFQMDDEGDIALEHAVHAESCTKEQLRYTATSIAKLADEYDDIIVERFGGLRAVDRK